MYHTQETERTSTSKCARTPILGDLKARHSRYEDFSLAPGSEPDVSRIEMPSRQRVILQSRGLTLRSQHSPSATTVRDQMWNSCRHDGLFERVDSGTVTMHDGRTLRRLGVGALTFLVTAVAASVGFVTSKAGRRPAGHRRDCGLGSIARAVSLGDHTNPDRSSTFRWSIMGAPCSAFREFLPKGWCSTHRHLVRL